MPAAGAWQVLQAAERQPRRSAAYEAKPVSCDARPMVLKAMQRQLSCSEAHIKGVRREVLWHSVAHACGGTAVALAVSIVCT